MLQILVLMRDVIVAVALSWMGFDEDKQDRPEEPVNNAATFVLMR